MKSNLFLKIFIAVCLCAILALTFTACNDKQIFAESSDFDTYPDDWNGFNNNGDIFIPNIDDSNTDNNTNSDINDNTSNKNNNSSNNNDSNANNNSNINNNTATSSEDYTANFDDGEFGEDSSNESTPSLHEPTTSDKDNSSQNSTITNQGPVWFFNS